MKKQKSLSYNNVKKRKILIGCAIAGTAVLTAGVGIGVGYAIWHSKHQPSDVITINSGYEPTLISVGEKTTITAESSLGKTVSLSATIDNVPVDDINIFDPATGIICYKNGNLEYKTITVVAEDGTAIPQSIKIGFDQIIPNPLRTLSLFPFTDHPNSYNQGVATYKSGVTQISFNTYDNPKLYISLQDYTDDQKLEWLYSTDNFNYSVITDSIGDTGITVDTTALGKIALDAPASRDTSTSKDVNHEA